MNLAAIRPSDWELPLFLHVLGAMVLVGGLFFVVTVLAVVWRNGEAAVGLRRIGFRSLLLLVIPAWLLTRIAGEWIYEEEDFADDPGWVVVGYITTEGGILLLVIATVLAGLSARRARRTGEGSRTLDRIATVLIAVNLAAYLIAMWAMTAKP